LVLLFRFLCNVSRVWLSCLGSLAFLFPKTLKKFGFSICWLSTYLTRLTQKRDCFTFFTKYSIDGKFKNWSLNLDQNKILKTYINNFLYLSWLYTLCCQFLKIVHFLLSLRYSLSFILSNLLRTMRFCVTLAEFDSPV
jgi:hypothetical protein